jgi:hypothetical protein
MNEIENFQLDGNIKDQLFSNVPFGNDVTVQASYDTAKRLADDCQNIILDRKKPDVFPDFVFEVAVLFEYISGENFTSANATSELTTKGEKFAEIACNIIAEMIYDSEARFFTHYSQEPWPGGAPKLYKIPAHKIKTACSIARDRIQSYGEKAE